MNRRYRRRKLVNALLLGLCGLALLLVLVPLASLLYYVVRQGLGSLNVDFFIRLPKPVGEPGGGMANAIVGTLTMVTLAAAFGLPLGILAGVYLAEFGRGRLAAAVRFACDVLTGVPSIVIGIFVYAIVVRPMGSYSALAGSIALAIIMLPVVIRTTEEMCSLVPFSLREASLALGASHWRTTYHVVLRGAQGGIVTGAMLATARVSGETAPLLFTALNQRFWQTGLTDPIASLPVYIFTYAISPFKEWHQQAWGAALVLVLLVLLTSVLARLTSWRLNKGR